MDLFALLLCAAYLLDHVFGDPRWMPHGIRVIGYVSLFFEWLTRKSFLPEIAAGVVTWSATLCCTLALLVGLLWSSLEIHQQLFSVLTIFLLFQSIAVSDLLRHSKAVYNALDGGIEPETARNKLARMVGRDTSNLDEQSIIRATVESVSENFIDGVVSPLFFAVVCSCFSNDPFISCGLAVLGAYAYKTINTLDSMFGYINQRYFDFGRFSARADDVANYLPARIGAAMLLLTAMMLRMNWRDGLYVFLLDRKKHSSPNAGYPEAVASGVLGISLGGVSSYQGKNKVKPIIGFDTNTPEKLHILQINRLVRVSSFFTLIFLLLFRFVVQLWS